LIKIKYTLVFF